MYAVSGDSAGLTREECAPGVVASELWLVLSEVKKVERVVP